MEVHASNIFPIIPDVPVHVDKISDTAKRKLSEELSLCNPKLILSKKVKQIGDCSYYAGSEYQGKHNSLGIPNGIGRLVENGKSYTGDFVNGYRHGKGLQESEDGFYDGEWVADYYEGQGKLIIPGLGTYEGHFEKGQYNGQGTFIWLNGDKYTGNFLNDKSHGSGVLEMANGNKYEGKFWHNLPHGKGTFIFKDGLTFIGDFVRGKFHGKGIIHYPNGDIYKGNVVDGKRHGEGALYSIKGNFVGTWNNDNKESGIDPGRLLRTLNI